MANANSTRHIRKRSRKAGHLNYWYTFRHYRRLLRYVIDEQEARREILADGPRGRTAIASA